MGIVTLARISGRPVVPIAMTTSRRKVLGKDLGQDDHQPAFRPRGLIVGEPIFVPADADDAEMERKRQEVTERSTRRRIGSTALSTAAHE